MDFTIDKTFYDIEANDLKELWDSDLDPVSFEKFAIFLIRETAVPKVLLSQKAGRIGIELVVRKIRPGRESNLWPSDL